jgi:hypothetical protein
LLAEGAGADCRTAATTRPTGTPVDRAAFPATAEVAFHVREVGAHEVGGALDELHELFVADVLLGHPRVVSTDVERL